MKNSNKNIANLLFEAAALKRLKRTGWQILGGGNDESIAEHSFMVTVISFVIAEELKADIKKVLITAIFHDFAETRTGEICKLADLYTKSDEKKAMDDSFSGFPEIRETMQNYHCKNLENDIVHDADVLALCIELKMLMEKGNRHAGEWFEANRKRLKLGYSKRILAEIANGNSQDWWKKQRNIIHQKFY